MAQVQSCITLTKQLLNTIFERHSLRFSSISFQILTNLWFGSLDENVVRGLVLNIGRKEGTCLFDINNRNTEYTTVKFCRETPTKAQSVPLSREPPTCHNT